MTYIASMNEQELRSIVLSQSEAIIRLINQLEAQETISEIQGMKIQDDASAAHKLDAWRYCTSEFLGRKRGWKYFSGVSAPLPGLRVLVKFHNGDISIATYYSDGVSSTWKNDRGQVTDRPMYWKGLEE